MQLAEKKKIFILFVVLREEAKVYRCKTIHLLYVCSTVTDTVGGGGGRAYNDQSEREREEQKGEPRVTQGPSVDRVGLHIRESAGCLKRVRAQYRVV